MDFEETQEYIEELKQYGSVPGLDSIRRLTDKLGNPQDGLNIIHIAGTNGKGSVGAFISSVLTAHGKRVCRFVSPAVGDYREMFTCDGVPISREDLARIYTEVRAKSDELAASGLPHPTLFETETAAAFIYCKEQNCDYAVLETGMGGLYDAVNVINSSAVSVITSISMDHTRFLGNTLEEIAYHKAGIIKENGTVISAVQCDTVRRVIEDECRKKGAALTFADKISNRRIREFDYGDMKDVKISLDGTFQIENAAAAIEACRHLNVPEEYIRQGLLSTVWHYRFEKISDNPVIILDGAHNPDAAKRLVQTIELYFGKSSADSTPGKKLNFIVGVLADKDYRQTAKITAGYADRIFCVKPDNPRAETAERLRDAFSEFNKNVCAVSLFDAAQKCLDDTERATIAFGSLSYLGSLKKIITERGRGK